MIFDQLAQADAYRRLGDRFVAGFAYLRDLDLEGASVGRHDIHGHDVFALVQSYRTKTVEESRWEAHRRYADIQYVGRGEERIGFAAIDAMQVVQAYDAEKDVAFFKGIGQFVHVPQGSFALFFPHDVHMPSVAIAGAADVRKVVVKVRLE